MAVTAEEIPNTAGRTVGATPEKPHLWLVDATGSVEPPPSVTLSTEFFNNPDSEPWLSCSDNWLGLDVDYIDLDVAPSPKMPLALGTESSNGVVDSGLATHGKLNKVVAAAIGFTSKQPNHLMSDIHTDDEAHWAMERNGADPILSVFQLSQLARKIVDTNVNFVEQTNNPRCFNPDKDAHDKEVCTLAHELKRSWNEHSAAIPSGFFPLIRDGLDDRILNYLDNRGSL